MTVHPCPCCRAQHDQALEVGRTPMVQPQPGDIGLCFDCGSWFIFDDGGTTRLPTPQEVTELDAYALLHHTRERWKAWRAKMLQ